MVWYLGTITDVRRHITQGKTSAVKGVGPSVPYEHLVVWCQSRHVKSKLLSLKGLRVLSPDIFAWYQGTSSRVGVDVVFDLTFQYVYVSSYELIASCNLS